MGNEGQKSKKIKTESGARIPSSYRTNQYPRLGRLKLITHFFIKLDCLEFNLQPTEVA